MENYFSKMKQTLVSIPQFGRFDGVNSHFYFEGKHEVSRQEFNSECDKIEAKVKEIDPEAVVTEKDYDARGRGKLRIQHQRIF